MKLKLNEGKTSLIASLSIIFVGLTVFTAVVFADNVDTSVTVTNAVPTLTVSLDRTAITLSENTFTWASATMTVTDNNGCLTIMNATATFYMATNTASNGTVCAADDNNCYLSASSTMGGCLATTTGNTCDGVGDSSVQYECPFKLWYIAEGTTGTGGNFDGYIWSVSATATDSSGSTGNATNSAQLAEINTLTALNVTGSIAYGSLAISGTNNPNATTTATTTGNIPIDTTVKATNDMCTDYPTCAVAYILSTQQEHSLTAGFAYGAGTDLASSSATAVELAISNPTSTTSPPEDDVYWRIQIPTGATNGAYTGLTVFTATVE